MPRELKKLQAVPFPQVQIHDRFWSPRREMNRRVSLPHSLDMLERSGCVSNLELAASGAHEGFQGPVFMDSDLYKTIEAVCYSLATHPDPVLEARIDTIIEKMAAAQMPDGYLNTYYQVKEPDRRWTNLRDNHEMYCAGHLFEAATAHFQATGKRTLLNIAIQFADHIDSLFGDGPGKRPGYPGHPELELALIKLWQVTGEQRYFRLAEFLVEHRGAGFFAAEHGTPPADYNGEYWQDNVPIREHRTIVGHAVRAAYLLSGVVDVAAETGDEGLLGMVDRVWENTTEKRMYVTGGIGPSRHNEGFTTDYDLPNETAYQETCASIAMAMWAHRLALLYGDARYADFLELALYNGSLAGVSLDGRKFFYENPLASNGHHHRADWFGCACCPPNLSRTLSSLGGYAYATGPGTLWVNLYLAGSVETNVDGLPLRLETTTDYPWSGQIRIRVDWSGDAPDSQNGGRFSLRFRQPAWAESAGMRVNGELISVTLERGYLVVDRTWLSGDVVELEFPMEPRRIEAHPRVEADRGRLALARGPLMYCLEGADHKYPLSLLSLPIEAPLAVTPDEQALGGIIRLEATGVTGSESNWSGGLYRTTAPAISARLSAIPYYAWDNRAPGAMQVWIPTSPPPPPAGEPEIQTEA